MNIIEKILSGPEFENFPPVLIDIGASGQIHKSWKKIARYSICIAFDADNRDFVVTSDDKGNYKKLYTFNCIVSDINSDKATFYLTKYPHCSSLLKPDQESLKEWSYTSYFDIEKETTIATKNLPSVLNELNISYVDWFKSDSQGIDLRLFQSLNTIQNKVIVAEFEPGIIDAYQGEDKLFRILQHMDNSKTFWLSDLKIKGSQKISEGNIRKIFREPSTLKLFRAVGRTSPGWGEMTYINKFNSDNFSKRDLLLGWIFSTLHHQHGFAYEIAMKGQDKFNEEIFQKLLTISKRKVQLQLFSWKYFSLGLNKIMRTLKLS